MRVFITVILFLLLKESSAQRFSITDEQHDFLYKNLDVPLRIIAENCPCNNLIVKTNNGRISGKNCEYTYHSDSDWKTNIVVYKKVKGGLTKIGSQTFFFRPIPNPIVKVGPSAGGSMKRIFLQNQQYIHAEFEGIDIDGPVVIDSFSVLILRSDSCLLSFKNQSGGRFSDQLIKGLQLMKFSDTIMFYNIYATMPFGGSRKMNTLMLEVFE